MSWLLFFCRPLVEFYALHHLLCDTHDWLDSMQWKGQPKKWLVMVFGRAPSTHSRASACDRLLFFYCCSPMQGFQSHAWHGHPKTSLHTASFSATSRRTLGAVSRCPSWGGCRSLWSSPCQSFGAMSTLPERLWVSI